MHSAATLASLMLREWLYTELPDHLLMDKGHSIWGDFLSPWATGGKGRQDLQMLFQDWAKQEDKA